MAAESVSWESSDYDLIVVGSGAAGLACAVTAASYGLRVALLEKTDVVGGTTAWSGGWIWAPRNPVAKRAGKVEPADAPREYLKSLLGNHFDEARVEAFLRAAPEMVAFFEERTALQFEPGLAIPDTYGHLTGAGTWGRSLIARPFDGRKLGGKISLLRKPSRETTFFGMTIQSGADLRAFMTVTRSARSFAYVTRRTLHHFWDLAVHGRGMNLRNGNALAARLLRSALDLSVDVHTGVDVRSLVAENNRVKGVRLSDGKILRADSGVVLACGGYPHDAVRRQKTFPRDRDHQTLAVPSATGDGLRLAEDIGAHVETSTARPAAFCPVSEVPWPDGNRGQFPHIIDRGKPGVIGVLSDGRRFCNEGHGYHDYVEALLRAVPEDAPAVSWLVCDHRFLRRFGLGVVRPTPVPYRHWIRRGYLKTGFSIGELAHSCGIDPAGLAATVKAWNEGAERGADPQYHRGTTPTCACRGIRNSVRTLAWRRSRKHPFMPSRWCPAASEHSQVWRQTNMLVSCVKTGA